MTFAVVITSVLLAAGMATFVPTVLSDDNENPKKCHATGESQTTFLLPPIATRYLPSPPPDAVFEFINRMVTTTWTGGVQGRGAALQMVMNDIDAKTAHVSALSTLAVSICNSEPGTLAAIFSIVVDNSASPPTFKGTMNVVEGSGLGGLKGICGGGTFQGPPLAYDFTFYFGKDCRAND